MLVDNVMTEHKEMCFVGGSGASLGDTELC